MYLSELILPAAVLSFELPLARLVPDNRYRFPGGCCVCLAISKLEISVTDTSQPIPGSEFFE